MALEEEAQICRLCGQCESIYIDVFGEEGTKRYLGLKIHTKINILIDERDPLPKAICVQCLGKLEFVCDFQEECLRTQQLLRDRFNWPSPGDVDKSKTEDTPLSSVNNNSIDKNQNPPDNANGKENGDDSLTDAERNITQSLKGPLSAIIEAERIISDEDSLETAVRNAPVKHSDIDTVDVAGETLTGTAIANLSDNRSQSVDLPNSKSSTTKNILPEFDINNACRNAPIANRLRSHASTTESNVSPISQTLDETNPLEENSNMVQIPTSTLNKVLTTVANSENMQVTVKESTSTDGRNEDINFIVELRHKQKADFVTVLAKVFPDQGSCMVDRGAIVKLLENQNGSEIRAIVDKVFNRSNSGVDDDGDGEARLAAGRNPEDLFRMDGEEISVDENIEHVIVEKRSRYVCRLCRKKYSRKDKCIVHVKTHLGIKQYLCTVCPAKFVCKSDVLKHIRSTHTNPRPFQCPKCPRRLRSKFDLTEHDNVHEGIKPYSCDECGLRYHHKVSLQMHAKSHLPSQNLACEYCGNVFPFRTRLLSHIASVHMKNRRNFRCHFCYNLYSSLSVLNDHIKSSHAATHVCEICGKEFKVKSKYKTHVLQHKNPRPFSCPICNNKYASRTFLSEHLSKHQGLRKHVCQKCGATFAQASHLAAHRHVHGEKKYPCPDCGRRFNRQDNMKVHRKRHIKPAPTTRPKEKQKTTKQTAKDNNAASPVPIEKIEEDDGLSKKVCMRCIGTLEFVSDFHNKCHQTQRQLLLDKERSQKLSQAEIKTDFESDKENSSPHSNTGTKEDVSCATALVKRKSSRMENKLGKLKKVKYKVDVCDENKIPGLGNFENSERNGVTVCLEAESSTEIKRSLIETNGAVIQGRKTASPRKRSPLATKIHDESDNGNGLKKAPTTRPGRKKRGRKGNSSTITSRKATRSAKTVPRLFPERNASIQSNTTESGAMGKEENFVKSSTEDQNTLHSLDAKFSSVTKEEINTFKGVPSEMMKIENSNSDTMLVGAAPLVKSDKLARVPSDVVIITPDGLSRDASSDSTAKSPRPGDEAGETRHRECDRTEGQAANDISKIVCIEDDGLGAKSLPKALMIRKSVIESVKNGKTVKVDTECGSANLNETSRRIKLVKDEVACERNELELIEMPQNLGMSTTPLRESSGMVCKESNKRERVGNFRDRRKKSEGQFGKLSELITDEQKKIIETLYTVNMGVVDDEEVYRNIKILDKVKVKCEICGKTYPRMDKCQVHVWGHLNMKPYCCKSCDFVTLTVSNIRCHIRKRHLKIKPFQCNLCEKTYGTAVLLEEHINSHTGAKPYKCKLCDFATSNRQVLSYHKTTHKPVKDISCEVCGKKFFSNCRMRAHMIIHNKDKSLMCKFCSTYLCNAEALEKHYQKVHSRDYVCDICGIRTRSRKALTNHENVHSEAKYRCPLCSNVYKSKHMLKEHVLKHQGIRKYKCELCEKSFAQQSHIAAHMSVHMGKRYPCPGCNKLFNRRDNMRIHTRRCRVFKSNPDTQSLWKGSETTRPIETDYQSIAVSETPVAPSPVTESTEKSKTATEKAETDLGLIRINLLTDKTDHSNSDDLGAAFRDSREVTRDEGFDQFQSTDGEILRIGEVEIFPLSKSNVIGIQNEGNTVITENVLRPECF